jgi:hypothetical protein
MPDETPIPVETPRGTLAVPAWASALAGGNEAAAAAPPAPRAFDIVAPDGKKYRLVAPAGATDEQVRAKALAVKQQLAAAPSAPAEPATVTTTTTPTTTGGGAPPAEAPPAEGGGLGLGTPEAPGLVGTALYRGIFRPAQELASAMPGATAESLAARKAEKVAAGVPGAANLPTEPATGILRTAGALLSPLEATVPWLFGLGTAAQWATDNEATGDAVEGAAGLLSLGRSVVRGVRAHAVPTVEGVKRPEYRGRSLPEVAYLEQEKQVAAAGRNAARAEESHVAAEDLSARLYARYQQHAAAAHAAEEANRAKHIAAENRVESLRQRLEADVAARRAPDTVVRQSLGLPPSAPGARKAGEMLTAAGAERTALAPGAEPVGVASVRFREAQRTRELYAKANAIADQADVRLPFQSASATETFEAVERWAERVLKYATPQERDAVKDIVDALTPARGHLGEILESGVPYSRLNDVYARLSAIALSPTEYAASANVARNEFARLRNSIQTSLRSLEVASPELVDAAAAARRQAREAEKVRQTAKALIGRTPEDAFSAMVANPTHLRRVFATAGNAEQDSYRMAFWMDEVEKATDATGMTDIGTLLRRWDALPQASRDILASGATAEARTAMLRLAAREQDTAATRAALRNAQKDVRDTLKTLRDAQVAWTRGAARAGVPPAKYGELIAARQAAADAEKEAALQLRDAKRYREAVAKEQQTLRELGAVTTTGKKAQEHARSLVHYHTFQAFRTILGGTGNIFSAATHAAVAYSLGRRPRLVRDAVLLPVDSPPGRLIADSIGAVLRGYRGFVEDDPDVVTPWQAAPLPPPAAPAAGR